MTQQELQGGSSAVQSSEARRLAGLVLARIAAEGGGEVDIARDLAPIAAPRHTPEIWRIEMGRLVAALAAGGLVQRVGEQLLPTPRGHAAAAEFLGCRKGAPASWEAARDGALVAKALGLEAASASRLKLIAKVDGLRAMIVVKHWGLKIKGAPTASRLRSALAVKALERAFGNQIGNGLGDKSALPAKAGRLLAGQMSQSGRDFGTDARLVAALAVEAVHARRGDLKSLRVAVLRAFVGRDKDAVAEPRRRRAVRQKRAVAGVVPPAPAVSVGVARVVEVMPPCLGAKPDAGEAPKAQLQPAALQQVRPGPDGFAQAVRAAANAASEGWPGNRKAFVSKVWALIRERHPSWGLTEIEFKCMLTEAHRTGLVALVNADLKDKRALKELQESAIIYKNTVWHYVRAED